MTGLELPRHPQPASPAGEAVAAYVDRELEIIEGIKRGLADVEAWGIVSHDKAMAEIYAAIDAGTRRKV
ncbi:hypothetical protein [Mesorhizobium sp. M0323]|uniref:hypothetical protein n=1 Tax=Mesorhizobium sp. M0323 TaxID=2956938 RepID=UPI0033395683